MSSWFKWRRSPPVAPLPAPVEEEEPAGPTMEERIAKWIVHFRNQARVRQAEAREQERVRERRRLAMAEAHQEQVAMHLAYKRYYVEGEPLEGPEMPRTEGGLFAEVFEERRQDFHWWTRS